MATGYQFRDSYTDTFVCLEGATRQQACETVGGFYWTFQGDLVCSKGPTTVSLSNAPVCDVAGIGGAIIEPLTFAQANILFVSIVIVIGLAWVLNLAVRFLLNR